MFPLLPALSAGLMLLGVTLMILFAYLSQQIDDLAISWDMPGRRRQPSLARLARQAHPRLLAKLTPGFQRLLWAGWGVTFLGGVMGLASALVAFGHAP